MRRPFSRDDELEELFRLPPAGTKDNRRRPQWMTWPWIICALAVVAILVVGTLRVALHDDSPAAEPQAAAPPAAPADVSACPDYRGEPPAPPASGTEHEWTQVGLILAPQDPLVGPAVTDPVRSCWAPGETGAVFAAANWLALTTTPETRALALQLGTADSPGRDQMLHIAATTDEDEQKSSDFRIVGYRTLAKTDDRVDVALAIHPVERARTLVVITVVRDDTRNDWLVLPPPSGRLTDDTDRSLPSMQGYTEWEG
jgi:hypothetical protein